MTHSFFYWYITDYSGEGFDVNQGSPFPPAVPSRMGINLCLSVRSVGQKKQRRNLRHLRNLRDLPPGPHNFYLI